MRQVPKAHGDTESLKIKNKQPDYKVDGGVLPLGSAVTAVALVTAVARVRPLAPGTSIGHEHGQKKVGRAVEEISHQRHTDGRRSF